MDMGEHNMKKHAGEEESPASADGFVRLHVVIHGMIGIRMSYAHRTVQLLIPSEDMHVYHAGTFGELKALPYGHDYRLGGVRAGGWTPDLAALKQSHLAISLAEQGLQDCQPRALHATVTLPWPEDVGGVRQLNTGQKNIKVPDPMFTSPSGMNPRSLRYIAYLTYLVEENATYHPVLEWNCCKEFWRQQNLHPHMRLHFFADPPAPLTGKQFEAHVPHAYMGFNDQIFRGAVPIQPDISTGSWPFRNCSGDEKVIVPDNEAIDFSQVASPGAPAIREVPGENHPLNLGEGGNCLPGLVLD